MSLIRINFINLSSHNRALTGLFDFFIILLLRGLLIRPFLHRLGNFWSIFYGGSRFAFNRFVVLGPNSLDGLVFIIVINNCKDRKSLLFLLISRLDYK